MIDSQLIRAREVASRLAICSATLWRLAAEDPTFPPKYRIGPNSVGWRVGEVDAWVSSREEKEPSP